MTFVWLVVGGVLVSLFTSEVRDALAPWMGETLVKFATRWVPAEQRDQQLRMWLADLDVCRSRLWKLFLAIQIVWTSRSTGRELRHGLAQTATVDGAEDKAVDFGGRHRSVDRRGERFLATGFISLAASVVSSLLTTDALFEARSGGKWILAAVGVALWLAAAALFWRWRRS